MRPAVCFAIAFALLPLNTILAQRRAPATLPGSVSSPNSATLKFDSTPLSDAIETMRKLTGINIHVNWKALEAEQITRDTPITLNVTNVTVSKALDLILSEASPDEKLSYTIDHGVLEVTTQELADKKLVARVYNVADLLVVFPQVNVPQANLSNLQQSSGNSGGSSGGGGGGGSSSSLFSNTQSNTNSTTDTKAQQKQIADDLVNLIKTTIRPEIWSDNGGPATIGFFNGQLLIRAPLSVHEAIAGRF